MPMNQVAVSDAIEQDAFDVRSAIAMSWRSVLPTAIELRRARRHLHAKSVAITIIVASS